MKYLGLIAFAPGTPLLANACAFLVAFCVSFAGNHVWTFQLPGEPSKAMRRFLLISYRAFWANTLILAIILSAGWFTLFFAAIISAMIIPLITFLASRFWGFQFVGEDAPPGVKLRKAFPATRRRR